MTTSTSALANAQRLTADALECLAFAKRRTVEIDTARNVAVLTIGRDTYYAELAAVGVTP